ncbi:hypothetical protein PHYBLDRAFT_146954 [Phycomyces blakesleeanus NRRL 1555(-)]|uniref:Uncharacterized protein n=1 Tax=Phycomyces blakesleeanus (strain ATCC 8743b / DSM 1359 / FGSC 10004 / NBRC 33097 / NRRL 1555) TaxID=763407 RepID=A0A163A9L0_PHYB8|nr:hypothetical protein PHYBLDRAFT_146954 [Phycomyces blakesleeanus NRRL 1555(-)]OAD71971.1 hypothetical protein PHYBLDRAFT_146954 [Phycomyces blakesleeanus NRRL 1555(-)]|eukprot:XP_018290011.1 hypothetical protein PHYBLDRAFT_146954 [Phycomyces blakesleeanus NRRL 1555(-)]
MNLAHHNAHHGCRACISYGARDSSTTCIVKRDGPSLLRTEESLHQSVGGMYGVKGPNIFKDLPTITSTAFFRLDEMHLLGHGTGQQLYVALGGKFCPRSMTLKHHGYPFALDVSLEDINKAICASRANIPANFTGMWRSLKEFNGKRKAVDWIDFLLFVVPMIVINHFVFDHTKAAVMNLVTAYRIAQQWRTTAANIQEAEEAIGHWHAFLCCEIEEKRLKPTVFVMNQHMLVHLGYMMWEIGSLWAYSCRPTKRTIGVYSMAIKLRKRTSNFEVASNNVAGPQLWSRPTQSSLAELVAAIGIECQNLVRSLVPFWAREGIVSFEENDEVVCANKMWKDLVIYRVRSSVDSRNGQANNLAVLDNAREYGFILKFFSQTVNRVTRLFVAIDCLSDVQRVNQDLFPVWDSLAPGVVKVVDVKSIKGIAGLIHDPNNKAIWRIIWLLPKYNQ